jgi:hypothetical protein
MELDKLNPMRLKIIVGICLLTALTACERLQDNHSTTGQFALNFLQDNQRDVPVKTELQVLMSGKVSLDVFGALTATLANATGAPVAGSVGYKPEIMVLVFVPGAPLRPGAAYVLTVTSPAGDTFTYHFTTAAGGATLPPVVTITAPAPGATVTGVIKVEATVTDDNAIAGNVTAALESVDTGDRAGVPWTFYINTVAVGNGLRLIEVRATDVDGNPGSGSVQVSVQNGPAVSTPYWLYGESLMEPVAGLTPSATLRAGLPPGGGVFIVAHAATDANYGSWNSSDQYVGDYELSQSYLGNTSYLTPGVLCLEIKNSSGVVFNMPASTITLTLPDHSTLTASLPALTINNTWGAAFYLAADGSSHWAYSGRAPLRFFVPPNITPTAALANPPAAP